MTQLKFHRLFIAAAAGLLVLGATASHALAQEMDPEELIARADTNDDGDISWEEVTALRSDSFDRLDRNDDGVVSSDDSPARPFAARFDEALERLQVDFDADRDGQITKDEMMDAPAPAFENGDANGDGILTAEEMATLRASVPAQ